MINTAARKGVGPSTVAVILGTVSLLYELDVYRRFAGLTEP
jgi:hypothetical protein